MGLLNRLRARLQVAPAPAPAGRAVLGARFEARHEEDWKELEEQVDAELKRAGTSIVGSWEVGAAELGRVVRGWPDDRALIERFSDALVPTLQPFQDIHKGVPSAMMAGLAAGRETGRMSSATAPLAELVSNLGSRAQDGWEKTTKHLDPLLARCADPAGARARFLAGGPAIARACADAEVVWRERLALLPEAPDLWEGLVGAGDAWQRVVTRGLEITIDGCAKGLVRELRDAAAAGPSGPSPG